MDSAEETFRNRIFRSATLEGMADKDGFPTDEYLNCYLELADNGVKNIITGCTYVSREGMMVQPGQAGIDSDEMISRYLQVTEEVHRYGSTIYLQISHAGRQTSASVTGSPVVGASDQPSPYFMSKPKQLSRAEIERVTESYAAAAWRAKEAGFDGVQIHAAHGYLVHQFLHPDINDRKDEYGIDPQTGIGTLFLHKIIAAVRDRCGADYPLMVKVSGSDDLPRPFTRENFIALIRLLDREKVFAIEVSYGTMENALSIFRGESVPLEAILSHNYRYKQKNPLLRKLWKLTALPILKKRLTGFSEHYNLPYAELAKRHTDLPVICVGGFRRGNDILNALETGKADYVSMCRPFICEPDIIAKLVSDKDYISRCENCNICAIMCDSDLSTRCYKRH